MWTNEFPWYYLQVNPVTGVWLFARYTLLVQRQRWTLDKMWEMSQNIDPLYVAPAAPPKERRPMRNPSFQNYISRFTGGAPQHAKAPSIGSPGEGLGREDTARSEKSAKPSIAEIHRNVLSRQAIFLAEQAKHLGRNFRIIQSAIGFFLTGMAIQYLYFAIVGATEDEAVVRWMNIVAQVLGMLAMALAAFEILTSHRPLVSEMTFQDRWERNMVKLGRLPASWGDMLRKKEAMGDANSVNATAAAAGVGVGAGSPTMFARHHDPGAHTHTLHHGHAGASVPVAVPDSNGIASSSGEPVLLGVRSHSAADLAPSRPAVASAVELGATSVQAVSASDLPMAPLAGGPGISAEEPAVPSGVSVLFGLG